jgi:undecaprenyl-diphosphatase
LATLIAVCIFFFKDIVEILKGFFVGLKNKNYTSPEFKVAIFILAATPITGIIGLLLKSPTEMLVENPRFISLFLILTGFILFFSEKLKSKNKR